MVILPWKFKGIANANSVISGSSKNYYPLIFKNFGTLERIIICRDFRKVPRFFLESSSE